MHTLFLTFFLVLFSIPASAETSPSELRSLALQVVDASKAPSDNADLTAASAALKTALQALRPSESEGAVAHGPRGHGHRKNRHYARNHDTCIDLGFEVYAAVYTESSALEKAIDDCRGPVDAELLGLAMNVYQQIYTRISAFQQAVEFAQRADLRGKASLVRLAFDVYGTIYTEQSALRSAAQWAAPLRWRSEPCIRRAYTIHQKTYTKPSALRQAVDTCASHHE